MSPILLIVQIWEGYAVVKCGAKTKREMEQVSKAWRTGDKKVLYSRNQIFKEVERLAEVRGISHVDAAALLDQQRKHARLHITRLQNTLKCHGALWEEHAVAQW